MIKRPLKTIINLLVFLKRNPRLIAVILIDNVMMYPVGILIGYSLAEGNICRVVFLGLLQAILASISTVLWLKLITEYRGRK